jgi:alpha-beta hydrolase superfamily lysophospholipase
MQNFPLVTQTTQVLMPPEVVSAEDVSRLSPRIADRHDFLTSTDGTRLFYRHWPASDWNGRVIVVLHGIGFHSGPYKVIADAVNPHGVDVYGLDARGHGLSNSRRGFVGTPAQVAADVATMIRQVRRQRPGARIFLLGDSMGADFALVHAKNHNGELAGLILLALALNLHIGQYLRLESLQLMPNLLVAHRKPVINLIGERLDESSRDPEFIARRRADPLAYKNVSFGYILDVQRLVWNWRWDIAPRMKMPLLTIMGDKDPVVSHHECLAFHKRAAAADKRLEIFPEVRHTTLWDPATPEILRLVTQWVLEH